eukprot:6179908-Pleurochrysis_carterae.AAC.2
MSISSDDDRAAIRKQLAEWKHALDYRREDNNRVSQQKNRGVDAAEGEHTAPPASSAADGEQAAGTSVAVRAGGHRRQRSRGGRGRFEFTSRLAEIAAASALEADAPQVRHVPMAAEQEHRSSRRAGRHQGRA